ncbi:MAG: FecR family protein, partial [Planctomycetota bacterium]
MRWGVLFALCVGLWSVGTAPSVRAGEDAAEDAAKAGERVAMVVAVKGRATAKNADGETRKLEMKSAIHIGDVLQTRSKSALQIIFLADKTTITIGQKARMRIDDYHFKAGDRNSKCETSLAQGAFKVLGGTIAKTAPGNVKVKTPTATIGIRGTLGMGVETPGPAGPPDLGDGPIDPQNPPPGGANDTVFMGGNAVGVSGTGPNAGQQTLLSGNPGTGCRTEFGSPPGNPRPYSAGEIGQIANAVSLAPGGGDDDDDDDD